MCALSKLWFKFSFFSWLDFQTPTNFKILFIASEWINKLPQHLCGDTASVVPFSILRQRLYRISCRIILEYDTLQIYTISFRFLLTLLVKIPFYTKHNFRWKINNKKKLHKSLNNSGTITPENMKFFLSYLFLLSTLLWDTHKTGRKFIQSNLLRKVCPWVITLNSYPEYIVFGWRIRSDFNEMLGVKSMDRWNLS